MIDDVPVAARPVGESTGPIFDPGDERVARRFPHDCHRVAGLAVRTRERHVRVTFRNLDMTVDFRCGRAEALLFAMYAEASSAAPFVVIDDDVRPDMPLLPPDPRWTRPDGDLIP